MRHRILLGAAFAYLVIANLIWIAKDTRPPFWDMAVHQNGALTIHDAISNEGFVGVKHIMTASLPYPPFYHSVTAVFYGVFGRTIDSAQYANIPAILLLILATYGIALTVLSPIAAVFSAILVSFYPIMLWLSRETVIDYWLTSLVAAAMWTLLRSEGFSKSGWSAAFALVAAVGMLTKWTFPFFVALPFVWAFRQNWRNGTRAAAVTAAIAAIWYIPAASSLRQLLTINSGQAVSEGDPSKLSLQAAVFYLRALEGYQTFLPLFVAFLVGAVIVARGFDRRWTPILLWLIGGWIGLMIFQNKDPRYTTPLLPAVAVVTSTIVDWKRIWAVPLVIVLLAQHYLVSFGVRTLPQAVVLARGIDGPLAWNWNLYTQQYFTLWGPPVAEDWQIERVLKTVSHSGKPVKIGIAPDIPRFDASAFHFYSKLHNYAVDVSRVFAPDETAILSLDFILISETSQGPAYVSPEGNLVRDYILSRPDRFEVVDRFSVPSGEIIQLVKVANT